MTRSIKSRRWVWAASIIGGIGTAVEAFIAFATLRSGFSFGVYDLIGVGLGLLALVLVWRRPVVASLLWLATVPLLYSGRLLVSVACLPALLFPLTAAGLALWSRRLSHRTP